MPTLIFSTPVLEHAEPVLAGESAPAFPQYGLLAGLADIFVERKRMQH